MKRHYEITVDIDELHGDCELTVSDTDNGMEEILYPDDLKNVIIMFEVPDGDIRFLDDEEGEDIYPFVYFVSSEARSKIEQECKKQASPPP